MWCYGLAQSSCERGFQRGWRVHSHKGSCSYPKRWLGRCLVDSVEAGSAGSDLAADGLERRALEGVRFWEFNVLRRKLLDLLTAALGIGNDTGSDDLDRVMGGTMST